MRRPRDALRLEPGKRVRLAQEVLAIGRVRLIKEQPREHASAAAGPRDDGPWEGSLQPLAALLEPQALLTDLDQDLQGRLGIGPQPLPQCVTDLPSQQLDKLETFLAE